MWRKIIFWGFLPHSEKWSRPLLLKQVCGRHQTEESLLPREQLLPSFWSGFQDHLFSVTFPKVPQEAGQLFTPNTGGRGRHRVGSLLTGSWREGPFRSKEHVLFFP